MHTTPMLLCTSTTALYQASGANHTRDGERVVVEIDDGKGPRVLGYIFLGNRACQVNTASPWNQSHALIRKDNGDSYYYWPS
jgi:hypothetical protein